MKLFIKLSFMFLLFTTVDLSAIVIKIVDQDNSAISGVYVILPGKIMFSNTKGEFDTGSLPLNSTIKLHKIGFKDSEFVLSQLTKTRKIIMERQLLKMSSISVKGEQDNTSFKAVSTRKIIYPTETSGTDLASVLASESSVEIRGNNLLGEKKTISLLGNLSRHTLVMLDGISLNQSGKEFDLSSIPLEIIDNIEIIKGSGSALAGSGSMAGIVNLNTKKASGLNTLKSISKAGSFGLWSEAINYSYANNSFHSFLNIAKSSAQNDFEYKDVFDNKTKTREFNDKTIEDFNLSLNYISFFDLSWKTDYQQANKSVPGPLNYALVYNGNISTEYHSKNVLSLSKKNDGLSFKFSAYSLKDNTLYDNTKSTIPFYQTKSKYITKILGIKSGFEFLVYPAMVPMLEMEYKKESFSTANILSPQFSMQPVYRKTSAVSGNLKLSQSLNLYELKQNSSYRYELTNDFKSVSTFRIEGSILKRGFYDTEIGGGYGTGYTLPSLLNLYWKGDNQTEGNPLLKTEKSSTYFLSAKINYSLSGLLFYYYDSSLEDLIYWYRSGNAWKPGNIADARITNYEVSFLFDELKYLSIHTNFTRNIALNKTTEPGDLYNKKLTYTPAYGLTVKANTKFKTLNGYINYNEIGEQYNTPDQLNDPIGKSSKVDVGVNLKFPIKKILFTLSCDFYNLTNQRTEVHDYYPQPGFYWMTNLNIEYKIK